MSELKFKKGDWVKINDVSKGYPAYDGKVGFVEDIVFAIHNDVTGARITTEYPYTVRLVDEPYHPNHNDFYDQWAEYELELITDEKQIFLYKLGMKQ